MSKFLEKINQFNNFVFKITKTIFNSLTIILITIFSFTFEKTAILIKSFLNFVKITFIKLNFSDFFINLFKFLKNQLFLFLKLYLLVFYVLTPIVYIFFSVIDSAEYKNLISSYILPPNSAKLSTIDLFLRGHIFYIVFNFCFIVNVVIVDFYYNLITNFIWNYDNYKTYSSADLFYLLYKAAPSPAIFYSNFLDNLEYLVFDYIPSIFS